MKIPTPNLIKELVSPFAGNIPSGPPSKLTSPTMIFPSRSVPVERITAFAFHTAPYFVTQSQLSPSLRKSMISACFNVRLGVSSMDFFIKTLYADLSACILKE